MAQNQRRPQAAALHNRPFQKLGTLIAPSASKAPLSRKLILPNLYSIGQDGVDHINISFNAETELGRALHQNAPFRFVHDLFGAFLTVEGFYRWLASENGDDAFRTLNGIQCAYHAKKTVNKGYILNLRFFVVNATWQKIKSYPEMMAAVGETTLPFDSYYFSVEQINGKKVATRMRYNNASWLVEGMETIREAIKNGVEPMLDFLLDDKADYEGMVELAKKAVVPAGVVEMMERTEKKVDEKPKLVPNPPGTGKKAMQKKRRLEREAEALRQAALGLTTDPTEPLINESYQLVVQPLSKPVIDDIMESVADSKSAHEPVAVPEVMGVTAAFVSPEHAVVSAVDASVPEESSTDVVEHLGVLETGSETTTEATGVVPEVSASFGGFGLPAQASYVDTQTSNDLGEGLPLDDIGPTE